MSFGQSGGPPASPKQVAYLKSLLAKAGYDDFRIARHTFGLTQRQAGGKFSGPEASALIDRLLGNEDETEAVAAVTPPDEAVMDGQSTVARGLRADVMADELRRRGWKVAEP